MNYSKHKNTPTPTLLVILAFVVSATLSSCSKNVAPRQGLVGEYLFKKNSNDQSTFQNHGAVHGATLTKGHTGKSKSAYHFNGSDQYIAIPDGVQDNFEHHQDFSISLWVALDSVQNDLSAPLNDVMRKWRGDTQGYPFAIVYYNPTAPDTIQSRFSFVKYDGSICRDSPQLFSTIHTGNSFVHIVCLKQGPLIKIYINGTLVSETTDTTRLGSACGSHNNAEITLGTRGNKKRFFTGKIDDVRIYNRALTIEEISTLYKL